MNTKFYVSSVMFAVLLAACGGGDQPAVPGEDDTQQPRPGGPGNEVPPPNGGTAPPTDVGAYSGICRSAATNSTRQMALLRVVEPKVLLEENFDAPVLPQGWTVVAHPGAGSVNDVVRVEDGSLFIDGTKDSYQMTTLALPAGFDDIENFRMEVEFTFLNANDANRWGSLLYRSTPGVKKSPYFQFAIRQNASAANGTEFAQRTADEQWNVVARRSFDESISAEKTYIATVVVHGNRVRQYLNNTLLHDVVFPDGARSSGGFGISTAGLVMRVDSVRIYEQREALPELKEPVRVQEVQSGVSMAPTIVQAVAEGASFDRTTPSQHMFCLDDRLNVHAGDGDSVGALVDYLADSTGSTLAVLYISDEQTVDALIESSKSLDLSDVTLVSDNPQLLRRIRVAIPNSRVAVDFSRAAIEGTSENILRIVGETNKALAKIAIVPPSLATRESIGRMQHLLITPWVATDTDDAATAAAILTTGVNGILADHPELFAEVLRMFPQNTLLRNPLIVGHRGIPSVSDENTLEGAKLAVDVGADAVENDIYKTTDNHLVIMHDDTLDRTTNGTGPIENLSLSEVKQLRTKTRGYEIPTLMEFFESFRGRSMAHFVEIKSGTPAVVDLLAEEVTKAQVHDQVVAISFIPAQIERMKNVMPEVSVGYLSSGSSDLKEVLDATQRYSTTYNPNYSSLADAHVMEEAKHRGVTFWPWTVNNQADFQRLYTQGVHGITTDYSNWGSTYIDKVELIDDVKPVSTGQVLERPMIRVIDKQGVVGVAYPNHMLVLPGSPKHDTLNGSVVFKERGTASVLYGYTYRIPGSSYFYNVFSDPVHVPVE